MLEGKEVEGKLGSIGTYHVDVNQKGELEVGIGIKIDLVKELETLAKKTSTPVDDAAIAWIKGLLAK